MRSALWLPLFDQLADPRTVARLAAEAEEHGWHALFVWDHVRWRPPVREVADPWVTLTAAAMVTERLRLGPMITPLARRRPVKVARETASLDLLSAGAAHARRRGRERPVRSRVLGDRGGRRREDPGPDARRGAGDPHRGLVGRAGPAPRRTLHSGRHDVPAPPGAAPRHPGVGRRLPGQAAPDAAGRAARRVRPGQPQHPDQLAEAAATIAGLRGPGPYDIAVELAPGADPRPYAAAGATWWLTAFDPESVTVDEVRGVLRAGPVS